MPDFLTVKEAAARARVSEPIVRGWVRDRLLAHFRLGARGRRGKIAIAAEDLDGLLASFRVVAASANEPASKPGPTSVPAARRKPVLKHLRL
jgi:excisionase family DNA binding protein